MPELPEVETTRRGVEPHVIGRIVTDVVLRETRLRWPVPQDLPKVLVGQRFARVDRRAKYLLLATDAGQLMIHLGMSGSLRVMAAESPALFHDHIDVVLDDGQCLRFNDPRRFGSFHWLPAPETSHPLLDHLGPEPLGQTFTGDYLYERARGRKTAIKQFLMDGKVVVGVGNIYANEALFAAGIHPARQAGRIAKARLQQLVTEVQRILAGAIQQGGTTLRDFVNSDGQPGYFAQQLSVYGRAGQACRQCQAVLVELRQNNRSTVFCPNCQR